MLRLDAGIAVSFFGRHLAGGDRDVSAFDPLDPWSAAEYLINFVRSDSMLVLDLRKELIQPDDLADLHLVAILLRRCQLGACLVTMW